MKFGSLSNPSRMFGEWIKNEMEPCQNSAKISRNHSRSKKEKVVVELYFKGKNSENGKK